jgi:2,3-bisphosphoglycerate-independent phosphoglycerate mutase
MVCRRLAFVLIDGIGDVALPQLEDLTPLQVASTPVLDSIAGMHQPLLACISCVFVRSALASFLVWCSN